MPIKLLPQALVMCTCPRTTVDSTRNFKPVVQKSQLESAHGCLLVGNIFRMRGFLSRFLDNGLKISGAWQRIVTCLACQGVRLSGGATVRGCDCQGVRLSGGATVRGCDCQGVRLSGGVTVSRCDCAYPSCTGGYKIQNSPPSSCTA